MPFLGIFFILLFGIGCSTDNTQAAGKILRSSVKQDKTNTCASHEDCMLISETCCSCNGGGKKRAVNKSYGEATLQDRQTSCDGVMCMQVISQDPSCKMTLGVCENGQCQGALQ